MNKLFLSEIIKKNISARGNSIFLALRERNGGGKNVCGFKEGQ